MVGRQRKLKPASAHHGGLPFRPDRDPLIDLRPGGFHDLAPSGAFGTVVLFEFIRAGCGGLATDITQRSCHRGQIPDAFHFRCDSLWARSRPDDRFVRTIAWHLRFNPTHFGLATLVQETIFGTRPQASICAASRWSCWSSCPAAALVSMRRAATIRRTFGI